MDRIYWAFKWVSTGRHIITEDSEWRTLWTWSGRCPWAETRLAQCQEPEQLQVQSACGTMEGSLRVNSFRQAKVDFPFAFFCEQFNFLITRSKLFQKLCQTMCLLNDGDTHEEVWLESASLGKGNVSIPFHPAFGDLSEQKGKPGLEAPVGRLPSSFSSTPCNQLSFWTGQKLYVLTDRRMSFVQQAADSEAGG